MNTWRRPYARSGERATSYFTHFEYAPAGGSRGLLAGLACYSARVISVLRPPPPIPQKARHETLLPALSRLAWAHAHETLIWASRGRGARHTFNYDLVNAPDPASQMSSVWRIPTVPGREKRMGRHPTQKPLRLVRRAVLASTKEGDLVFDPFTGSGTTAVAAKELGRFFVGAELEDGYAKLAARRIEATNRGGLLREISERFWSEA